MQTKNRSQEHCKLRKKTKDKGKKEGPWGEKSKINMQIILQEERLERVDGDRCIAIEDLWQVVMEH